MFKRLLPALLVALALSPPVVAEPVHVQAAASLTDVMSALIAQYEQDHDARIVPVYAASSTLARQIAEGAPADLYLSANRRWMDWLETQPVRLSERRDLLKNRLALVAPRESAIEAFTPDADHPLLDYLDQGGGDRRERLAVGDTDHVPAGLYARQAFEATGQWAALAPRLARASDVRGALALVERGEAPLGAVYATDARASERVRILGLFPESSHDAITYPMALVGASPGAAARAFFKWLGSDAAAQTFRGYGFETFDDGFDTASRERLPRAADPRHGDGQDHGQP